MIFLKNREKQGPVIALVVICLIILLFVWKFAFSDPPTETVSRPVIKSAPRIDFDYLESPELDHFVEYEKIDPLEDEVMGRENPFLPY